MNNFRNADQELLGILGLTPTEDSTTARVVAAFVGRYDTPSSLQRRALHEFRNGGGLLLVAPTAAGKTEAALMPMVVEALTTGARILYIAPTRALINDLADRLRPGFSALGLTVEARHGDAKASQRRYAEASCVITTPESLEVALEFGEQWLAEMRQIFLDELHAYDRTPRGTQLRVLLTRLSTLGNRDLRVVGASATVPGIERVAEFWGRPGPPLRVVCEEGQRPGRLDLSCGSEPEIRSWLASRDAPDKILLFANSRRRCDELFLSLQGASDHVVLLHYSNLEAGERAGTEALLRTSDRVICVATSTLELGIDVGDIDVVGLVDAPWSSLSLVQRVGRAGRRAGAAVARGFVSDDRTLLRIVGAWAVDPNTAGDDGVRPRFPSVGVQQSVELTLASHHIRVRPERLQEAFRDSGTFSPDEATNLVEHLSRHGVFAFHQPSRAYEFASGCDLPYSRDRWGNFPSDRATWILAHKGRAMSAVEFGQPPTRGDVVLYGGQMWRITGMQRRRINVVPCRPVENPIRVLYSDAPPLVPASLAAAMRSVVAIASIPATVTFDIETERRLRAIQEGIGGALRMGAVPIITTDRGPKLLTFAGTRANLLIARALAGAGRADELGIELDGKLASMTDVKDIVPTYERLLDLASRSWQGLRPVVTTTRWHEYLPPKLQRDEVVSQFDGPGVASAIEDLRQRSVAALVSVRLSL